MVKNVATFPILDKFEETLKSCTRPAHCGRPYVLVKRLTSWLQSDENVAKLLQAYHPHKSRKSPSPQFNSDTILKSRPLLFAILIHLRFDEKIVNIILSGYVDDHLHCLTKEDLEGFLVKAGVGVCDAENIAKKVISEKHKFCSRPFELNDARIFNSWYVVPIEEKLFLNKGGFGVLEEVRILEEFVGQELRDKYQGSRYVDSENRAFYRFALKSFKAADYPYFNREVNAHFALRQYDGIIKYLGHYTDRKDSDPPESLVHHILFEYGTKDLHEWFKDTDPPTRPQEIFGFWQALFKIADALAELHNCDPEWKCWHADIKPKNIVIVNRQFKLADLGLASFEIPNDKEGDAQRTKLGHHDATWTWGSPELSDGNGLATQKIDIWSLGAVFSVAATWIVGGPQMVKQYKAVRMNSREAYLAPNRSGQLGDSFHNDIKPLPDVLIWHKYLRASARRTDTVTSCVLDLIDKGMLQEHHEHILNAKKLRWHLQNILDSISTPALISSDIIERSLRNVNDRAVQRSNCRQSSGKPSNVSTIRGSTIDESDPSQTIPVKETAYRYETQPRPPEELATSVLSNLPDTTGTSYDTTQRLPILVQDTIASIGNENGVESSQRRQLRQTSDRTVAQAQEEEMMKLALRSNLSNWWKRISSQTADSLFKSYISNRHLVFLMDNTSKMSDSDYGEAKRILNLMVKKCAGLDREGVDVYFTNTRLCRTEIKNPQHVESLLKEQRAQPNQGRPGNVGRILRKIFEKHLRTLGEQHSPPKNFTLIFLTEGAWTQNPAEFVPIEKEIASFISGVVNKRKAQSTKTNARFATLQFVHFGRNLDAMEALRYLDDDLSDKYEIPDCIDLEHSTGNFDKMVLGSISRKYDDAENPVSPTRLEHKSRWTASMCSIDASI